MHFLNHYQLLREFEMTKPELERYVRDWTKNNIVSEVEMINLNEWISWLHNSGK